MDIKIIKSLGDKYLVFFQVHRWITYDIKIKMERVVFENKLLFN